MSLTSSYYDTILACFIQGNLYAFGLAPPTLVTGFCYSPLNLLVCRLARLVVILGIGCMKYITTVINVWLVDRVCGLGCITSNNIVMMLTPCQGGY